MNALLVAGVGVLGAVLGSVLGYWYRKREHLRELRVERYADFQHRASDHYWLILRAWRVRTDAHSRSQPGAMERDLNSSSNLLTQSRSSFLFVASPGMNERARALLAALAELRAVLRADAIDPAEWDAARREAADQMNQLVRQGAVELWGRRRVGKFVPDPPT